MRWIPLLLLFPAAFALAGTIEGKVIHVADGDTLTILAAA